MIHKLFQLKILKLEFFYFFNGRSRSFQDTPAYYVIFLKRLGISLPGTFTSYLKNGFCDLLKTTYPYAIEINPITHHPFAWNLLQINYKK